MNFEAIAEIPYSLGDLDVVHEVEEVFEHLLVCSITVPYVVQVVTWLDFEKADWGSVEGDSKVLIVPSVSTTPWDMAMSDYKPSSGSNIV